MTAARELYRTDPDEFSAAVREYSERIKPLAGNLSFGQAMASFLQTEDRRAQMSPAERDEFDAVLSFQIAKAKTGTVLSYSQAREVLKKYGLDPSRQYAGTDPDERLNHLARQRQTATGKTYSECLREVSKEQIVPAADDSRTQTKSYHTIRGKTI